MSYEEGIPRNMTKSYWSNVATRWNSNADSNVWIKLLGTTDIQSQFTGVNTVRFDWGENICLENVEINSAPLYPPYPTWFHGKSIFEVGKVNCVAPSINKQKKNRKKAKKERKKSKLATIEWMEKHTNAHGDDGGCPVPAILESRGVVFTRAKNNLDASNGAFSPGTRLLLSCENGMETRPRKRLKCKCKTNSG
ncbi:Oidioi.mRNA.OKI2018_I69.PAR.g10331.t1.cds [Oikopleura dioica]|uniref:Oidioi.mRNA.OKI2018_I69.PAR.g10331.t1.cds n=1 Tax=Oikopleura dioica TaxID=34765 RepID=A0ABN7RVB8_OIKDI|nr:Oidioi.mRNA.OKI2018_I69.PAR.g10331.t1.cds [Oikopleura dioica]